MTVKTVSSGCNHAVQISFYLWLLLFLLYYWCIGAAFLLQSLLVLYNSTSPVICLIFTPDLNLITYHCLKPKIMQKIHFSSFSIAVLALCEVETSSTLLNWPTMLPLYFTLSFFPHIQPITVGNGSRMKEKRVNPSPPHVECCPFLPCKILLLDPALLPPVKKSCNQKINSTLMFQAV